MEKLLVTSSFSVSHSVYKKLLLQTRKKGLHGKGLKNQAEFSVVLFCILALSPLTTVFQETLIWATSSDDKNEFYIFVPLVPTCEPQGRDSFDPKGHHVNKIDKGLQGDATYRKSKLYLFQFQRRNI